MSEFLKKIEELIDKDHMALIDLKAVATKYQCYELTAHLRVIEKEKYPDKALMSKEGIAKILRDNITFSGQLGDYVVHGAAQKIIRLHESILEQERKKNEQNS